MIGTRVGDYRITRRLGEGGIGAVYEATHEAIGGRFAIKVLREDQAHDPEWVARLFDEARAVNLIGHEGLVKVVHFGQLDDGRPYLVMEFVSGETLDARLQAGRVAQREAVCIGYQLALALQAAHAAGIVHRDLKPSNLMLVHDPAALGGVRVKVLDFGIAKLPRGDRAHRTQTGMVFGTPAYMPPEQFMGTSQVDGRGDVYSLGIVLYELFAGRRPFEHDEPVAYMFSHVNKPPPPLAERAPQLAPQLVQLVERMLKKERIERPDMAEVAACLAAQLDAGSGPGPQPLRSDAIPTQRRPALQRPGRVAALAITAGGVLIAGGFGARWLLTPPSLPARDGGRTSPAPATAATAAAPDLLAASSDLAAPAPDLAAPPPAPKRPAARPPVVTRPVSAPAPKPNSPNPNTSMPNAPKPYNPRYWPKEDGK